MWLNEMKIPVFKEISSWDCCAVNGVLTPHTCNLGCHSQHKTRYDAVHLLSQVPWNLRQSEGV